MRFSDFFPGFLILISLCAYVKVSLLQNYNPLQLQHNQNQLNTLHQSLSARQLLRYNALFAEITLPPRLLIFHGSAHDQNSDLSYSPPNHPLYIFHCINSRISRGLPPPSPCIKGEHQTFYNFRSIQTSVFPCTNPLFLKNRTTPDVGFAKAYT